MISLYSTPAIDLQAFNKTFLVAPPPPPPAAAPVRVISRPRHLLLVNSKLIAPVIIPKHVAILKEAPPLEPSAILSEQTGGVPGGVPGGRLGGVLGGILSGTRTMVPPPPPLPKALKQSGPIPVGGFVKPPQLIRDVTPSYPLLAREARIQGDVVLDAVLDKHGDVTQLQLVSGNALLVPAAMHAVEDWKYEPTLLDGQPVSVEMHITVQFRLGEEG
jgi:protein TonB